ncbi:MAG: hypothetical protein IJH32_10190 [Ruminococcus sp.]|nr:hypothetical protein [Ruminococcus sp.]
MKMIKKFISNGWLVFSSIVTLLSGIASSILNGMNKNEEWYFYVVFGLFLFGISLVLIQILVLLVGIDKTAESFDSLNERFESIEKNIQSIQNTLGKDSASILAPAQTTEAQSELEKLINSRYDEIERIKIICYGTSGYGDLIYKFSNGVYDKDRKIQLDVMFCSLNAVFSNNENDKNRIIAQQQEIKKNQNIHLYNAKYLPTIRCCAVYGKNNKPIWNCIQHYVYTNDSQTSSAIYTNSFALIGRENNPKILNINSNCINFEFDRLKMENDSSGLGI